MRVYERWPDVFCASTTKIPYWHYRQIANSRAPNKGELRDIGTKLKQTAIEAAKVMKAAPFEVGPGQGKRTDLDSELRSVTTKLGRGSTYLAARIKRDRPDIAAPLQAELTVLAVQ